jgi:hypothetical protein
MKVLPVPIPLQAVIEGFMGLALGQFLADSQAAGGGVLATGLFISAYLPSTKCTWSTRRRAVSRWICPPVIR